VSDADTEGELATGQRLAERAVNMIQEEASANARARNLTQRTKPEATTQGGHPLQSAQRREKMGA